MSVNKNILCFGDSLTWGWMPNPNGLPTTRYSKNERWTGVMAAELGQDYTIIEEGLSGRTTDANDPNDPRLNGAQYLPSALASHLPLDLVILMLGTNDTKSFFKRSSIDIMYGMAKLVGQVGASAGGVGTMYPAPKVLVVAPPPLNDIPIPFFKDQFEGGENKSKELATKYRDMCDCVGVPFLNAGDIIQTDGDDGVHFTKQNNLDLGKAIARKVQQIL